MSGQLAGRTVVVFGGSGALGRAVVERFGADGAAVVVADPAPVPAGFPVGGSPADGSGPGEVRVELVDALDEPSVATFFDGVEPAPWAVANCVGGYPPGQRLADLDIAVLRRQLELNLVTAATITKHAIRRMAAGGRLIHTASRAGLGDGHGEFAYSVSKAGVLLLVQAAAAETRQLGITVNCVVPSIIDTPANRAAIPSADHASWPKPAEIATVFAFLASDAALLVSGAAVPVYGRS